jgi:hypothetical protein
MARGGDPQVGFADSTGQPSVVGWNREPSGWDRAIGPESSSVSSDQPDIGPPGAFVVISFTYSAAWGAAGGGWLYGTGSAAPVQAPFEAPGLSGLSPGSSPGGHDPGAPMDFGRTQDPAYGSMGTNAPLSPLFAMFTPARDHQDALQMAMMPAGPMNAPPVASGPGVLALAALNPGAGAAPGVGGSAPQAVPAAWPWAAQSASLIAPDGSGAGRSIATTAVGVAGAEARGAVEQAPTTQLFGRNILARTLPHPLQVVSPGNADPAVASALNPPPSPRGAELIAAALPFAGDSLERSLDDFVRQLETVDVAALVTDGRTPIAIASLALASAAASAVVIREVGRRRSMRGRGPRLVDPVGRELALSFPELPRSWSERRR